MSLARPSGTPTSNRGSPPPLVLLTGAGKQPLHKSGPTRPERAADPQAFASGVLVGVALTLAALAATALF